ncbi:uncharacterized protein LOC110700991 [Chenopodium quinoa]|uniref:Uncharacterized protein n=1 Tax=Chenopodium quinoa TaxID=63459 RepID=A0A803L3W9_CHEQI|nr:uncharacterized protein LOC110700991 [Chenopodium quinoa]
MESISPNKDDFYSYYTSAPTSPRRYNRANDFFFLSMPTSPSRNSSRFKSGSITPVISENYSPYADFEFEGSKRFDPYENNGFEKSGDLSIAYADELFCDGKMVPLRLPPRAHDSRVDKRRGNHSTASSPGGRSSKVKVPFLRQRSLWNDGFDPFLAALNKVKEEKNVMGSSEKKAQLRRSKSLSPFRRPIGSARCDTHHKHSKVVLSPKKDDFGPFSPFNPSDFGPILELKENMGKSESLECRKQRIKKYLLKNASFGKNVNEEKKQHKTPLLLRKMHNSQIFGLKNSNTIFRISRGMKSLVKHRARIFYCLAKGFGIKGTTKMS